MKNCTECVHWGEGKQKLFCLRGHERPVRQWILRTAESTAQDLLFGVEPDEIDCAECPGFEESGNEA